MTKTKRRGTNHGIADKVVFFILAIAYLAFLVHTVQYIFLTFNDCTAKTKGIVTEIWSPMDGNARYYPTFQITVNGKTYEHRQNYASKEGDWKEGDQAEIKYNPENPSKMFSQGEIDTHKGGAVARIIGVVVFGLMLLRLGYLTFR